MIAAIASLLFCQLLGEVIVRALSLPLPGPVAGMGLLFGFLMIRGRTVQHDRAVPQQIGLVADALLRNLSLLFIPAAVGVVQYLGLLRAYAGTIALSVAISTVAALVGTVVTFRFVSRLHAFRHKPTLEALDAAADVDHGRRSDAP